MAGMAFPGTIAYLDRRGRVTWPFFEDFYAERNTVSSVFKQLAMRGQAVAAQKVTTEHLELTTYSSDAGVAPGNRFSVVVDIAPKRGMHVYAPGAAGYRIVTVKIADQPAIRVLAPRYPASEIYHLQTTQRACAGLPEAVPGSTGPRSRGRSAVSGDIPRERDLDHQWHARVSGVR